MRRIRCAFTALALLGTLVVGPGAEAQVPPAVAAVPVAILEQPVAMAVGPGDDLYVVEQTGRIRAIRDGILDLQPVLDLSDEVSGGFEQGLLGLAFHPDGDRLYVDYTDLDGTTHVTEFAFEDGVADPETRRDLLVVDQPFANHNGGTLNFGPDGHLYVSLGDGGDAGDPNGNGQDPGTLLGTILRIDPTPSGELPYTIPEDNPFVGDSEARDEIWAYGLRNPWKYAFDRETGDLWIADVGQGEWEEVDFQPAASDGGENYGWNAFEGTHRFDEDTPPPDEHVRPVYEYDHTGGRCSITGGRVYRGSSGGPLTGAYVFGDFCDGILRSLRFDESGETVVEDLGAVVPLLTSFGEDADGELYALSLAGLVFRLVPTGL